MSKNLSWKVLSEETIIKDPWIDLRASTCLLPNGLTISPFYVNHLPNFAVVVAVTPDPERKVVLVRQYRHGAGKVLLELPAGCIEAGEEPEIAAARELLEETGYKAEKMEYLFQLAPNATNCTSYAQCYLAWDVMRAGDIHLDETESLEVVVLESDKVRRLMQEGGFEQAVHVAALYRAMERVGL